MAKRVAAATSRPTEDTERDHLTSTDGPLLDIEYAFQERFLDPPPPTKYGVAGSILSIASLVFMTLLATIMLISLRSPGASPFGLLPAPAGAQPLAAWTWIPFVFTIFGAGLGAIFETYLLLTNTPFQQTRSSWTTAIRNVRLMNLAPVTTSILFAVICMVVGDPSMRLALLYLCGGACFGLAFALFFGGAEAEVGLILPALQLVQIALVVLAGLTFGGKMVAALLILQALLQLTSLLLGALTPLRSTAFHVISSFSGLALYAAIVRTTTAHPGFSHQVAVALPPASLHRWGFVAACLAGLLVTARLSPRTYNNWRSLLSNAVWSFQYFLLVSAPRFPNPLNLSEVYRSGAPKPISFKPYSRVHPKFEDESLQIPAATAMEGNVAAYKALVAQVTRTFALISELDHWFPQADTRVPLAEKPRLPAWSDGSEYWPRLFTKKLFGRTIPGRTLERAPAPAIAAYKDGHLLAYLAESGVASTLLRAASDRDEGTLVIDLDDLSRYDNRADYELYGGRAYFRVDAEAKRLRLLSVVAPQETNELAVDPRDSRFRRAEAMILASMYFKVISGKHLAEMHMTHNLVELALHNAFDARGQFAHPFRTFLYLHLFSHELAEELTTEHLVQDGAVFNQIFATTHDGLVNHLNDAYEQFQFGVDEDFEARAAMLSVSSGKDAGEILPHACIRWELEYAEIWQSYVGELMDAIYKSDEEVQADTYLQAFHSGLLEVLRNGLPARYDRFQTKSGVARFASDLIHHLVVRHQVYGTTGVKGLDPRISSTQVPRDAGTSGVDEWRSMACVALATARARFVLLIGDFRYLLDGVDERYAPAMKVAFDRLQNDLKTMDTRWTATPEERAFNYDYFRAIPSELHTGPGY